MNINDDIGMTIPDLIQSLRDRINPDYATQRGTESYERRICAEALDAQQAEIDWLRALLINVRLTDELNAWRAIETLPRTGKMVLMWSRHAGYFAGNWPPGCEAGVWHKVGGDWHGSLHWRAQDATHWMPLPETPNAELRDRPLADGPA